MTEDQVGVVLVGTSPVEVVKSAGDSHGQRDTAAGPLGFGRAELAAYVGTSNAGLLDEPEGRQWDEQSLFADLVTRRGGDETRVARELYQWMLARGWRPSFGRGKQDGSCVPVIVAHGREYYPIALYSYGRIEIQFQHLKPRAPFDNEQARLELLRRVNEIPEVSFGPEVITRRPSIQLSLLATNPDALEELKSVLEWVEEIASTAGVEQTAGEQ